MRCYSLFQGGDGANENFDLRVSACPRPTGLHLTSPMKVADKELTMQELVLAREMLQRMNLDSPFTFSATRYKADYGEAEIVEVKGTVHTKYPREDGNWVNLLEADLRAGLFTLD